MINLADLFEQLKFAEDENGVEIILREANYLTDDSKIWAPFGNTENNFSTIGNQQSDPTGAFVEKIINSIDAMLMAGCYQHGINPRGSEAPKSMAEAVGQFFGVRDGHLNRMNNEELRELAENIHVVATGNKKFPNYLIIDRGEGQTPMMFPKTFLSLLRTNKIDIPFVQGKFNAGGTGVLQFCGEKNYQLVASRRHPSCPVDVDDPTKDLWGFTLVRRLLPAKGRRSSMYVYLAPGGEIPFFRAEAIRVLPKAAGQNIPATPYELELHYGTFIKLYNYRGKGTSTATTDGRYELEKFLLSSCLPFRISETREGYRANYYSATVTGGWNRAAAETAEGESKHFEDGFPAYGTLNLEHIGILPYQIAVFTPEREARNFPYGISFIINGQVHGTLSADFIKSRLKFEYLTHKHGPLLVLVDCTSMNEKVREDFFMASRDRMRRNEVYKEIEHQLEEELREHPGLQAINQKRRKEANEHHLTTEAPIEVFQTLLKADPTIASLFSSGDRLSTTTGPGNPPAPFEGRKFPKFFRLKNPKEGAIKECSVNRTCRIEFETDAMNDYFQRSDCPGKLIIEPTSDILEHQRLWNGRYETRFRIPWDAEVGALIPITISVSDVAHSNPFICHFTLKATKEDLSDASSGTSGRSQKPSPNGRNARVALATPNTIEVRKADWERYGFTQYHSIQIRSDGESGYDYYINIDSAFLYKEFKNAKEADKPLVKYWFTWGLILAAMGMIHHNSRLTQEKIKVGNQAEDVENIEDGNPLEEINHACNGLAEMIIPIIRSLFKGLPEE